jgi:hypothetical protein
MAQTEAKKTTDHEEIRRWAEERGCRPAAVKQTGNGGDPGILRFDCGEPEESLEELSWDEFFQQLDENGLAVLLQDETKEGGESRFFKFVKR